MILLFLITFVFLGSLCCTNFIISPGATEDGSSFIAYAADSHTLYGCLYYRPVADYPNGTMMDIYDWDSGKYLGQIAQATHTNNVVANTNEYQVTIGETTFGGLTELANQPDAKIDYGNLMWVTLQRVKTARDAVIMMGKLVAEYGYYSQGESFSIGDPNEVWIMELIGKGSYELGAVWVAQKIPDGAISAHANQARTTTFPLDDPENCLYSSDVVTFAQDHGFYPKSKNASDFSFADVYDPINFIGARFCEARVYSYFSKFTDVSSYLDYAQGYNLTNRMPLYVYPDSKISLSDVFDAFRDHYEGTWFDMMKSIDSGNWPFTTGYRWRPLTFSSGGTEYLNERAISTFETAMSFVAQGRKWLDLGGITWFGVDDTYTTVWAPMYSVMQDIPKSYSENSGAIMEFTFDSIFWIFNMVAHLAYLRYDILIQDIQTKQSALESRYMSEVKIMDHDAQELYEKNPEAARKLLSDYSIITGDELLKEWTSLYGFLFTKYLDGDVRVPVPGQLYPKIEDPGYPQYWYDEIAATTGDHLKVPPSAASGKKRKTQNKLKFI